jgi:hypothetical protein
MKPLSFFKHLRKQQHELKVIQLKRAIQSPCFDRAPDLKEMLTSEPIDVNIVAVAYPVSTN